jgi:hypothetical protein
MFPAPHAPFGRLLHGCSAASVFASAAPASAMPPELLLLLPEPVSVARASAAPASERYPQHEGQRPALTLREAKLSSKALRHTGQNRLVV